MRHKFRFSIATLLILTFASALLSKWMASPIALEEGVEEWTETGILSYSIAIVDASYPRDRWDLCAVTSGEGHYCHLAEGGTYLNSTGGWYFSLGVQLPIDLADGWTTELKTIADLPDGNVRKLNPGEIIAMQFGHPSSWQLVSGSDASLGTLTIVKADRKHATIKIAAKIPLRGMIDTDHEVVLDIDRTFELDCVSPKDPLAQIPRKSQISKR